MKVSRYEQTKSKRLDEKFRNKLEEVTLYAGDKFLGMTYDEPEYAKRMQDIMAEGGEIKADLGETVLWSHQLKKGFFKTKSYEIWMITNFRIIKTDNETNKATQLPVKYIDAIVMNLRTRSQSQGKTVGAGVPAGILTGMAFSQREGQSMKIGDLVFIFNGQVLLVFENISDPNGVRKLFYTIKKQLYKQDTD